MGAGGRGAGRPPGRSRLSVNEPQQHVASMVLPGLWILDKCCVVVWARSLATPGERLPSPWTTPGG